MISLAALIATAFLPGTVVYLQAEPDAKALGGEMRMYGEIGSEVPIYPTTLKSINGRPESPRSFKPAIARTDLTISADGTAAAWKIYEEGVFQAINLSSGLVRDISADADSNVIEVRWGRQGAAMYLTLNESDERISHYDPKIKRKTEYPPNGLNWFTLGDQPRWIIRDNETLRFDWLGKLHEAAEVDGEGLACLPTISPSGQKLAILTNSGFWLATIDKKLERLDQGPYGKVRDTKLFWSPDSRYVATISAGISSETEPEVSNTLVAYDASKQPPVLIRIKTWTEAQFESNLKVLGWVSANELLAARWKRDRCELTKIDLSGKENTVAVLGDRVQDVVYAQPK